MADDDENLQLTLTGSDDGASAAAQAVADVIARLEAQMSSVSAVGKTMGDGIAAGARTGAAASEGLSVALKDVEGHSLLVARGLNAVGLEADAGAVKVGALAGVLADLGKSTGPLLAVAAVIEAISNGFKFFEDGVKDAAELQSQMASLEAVVKSQGGSWEQARDSIEKFVATESVAAGYTSGELVSALNSLVSAGNDVKDSETLLAVATELARAKHIDLKEAVDALLQAENGRTRGLVALDHNVKAVVDSHGKLSDAIRVLNKDYKDVIDNTNTAEMAHARLDVAQKQLGEDIGAILIPAMTAWDVSLMGGLRNAEDLAKGVVDYFRGAAAATMGLAAAAADLAEVLNDIAKHDYAGATKAWTATQHAWNDAMRGGLLVMKGQSEIGNELFHGQDAYTRGLNEQTAAIKEHNAATQQRLDQDHQLTNKQPGSGSSGGSTSFSYTPYDLSTGGGNEQDAASQNKDLLALIATTSDLTEKQRELSQAVSDSAFQQQFYDQAVVNVTKQLDAAKIASNAYNAQISAQVSKGTAESTEQTNKAAELADRVKQLKAALDEATKAQQGNRDATAADTAALDENAKAMKAVEKAADELAAKHRDYTEKEDQRVREALGTFEMTNAQKVAYYQQVLDQLNTLDKNYEAEYEAALKARDDAEIAEITQRKQAYEDFIKTVQGLETSFIDDIITKHESLATSFKNVLNEMLDDYKKWIEQMMVSSLLKGLNTELAQLFGGVVPGAGGSNNSGFGIIGPEGASNAAAGASQYGIFGALAGPSGAQQIINSLPTGAGNSSSAAAGAVGSTSDLASVVGGDAYGSGTYQISGGSSPGSLMQLLGPNGNKDILDMLQGAGVGSLVAGMDGGNTTWGSLGGSLGGLAAALTAANPLAGLGLEIGGSLIGSMFGPHWGPATNYPDRSDTQNYGQFLANWQGGNPSVNGTTFHAASQYNTLDGGTPEIDQMEQWAAGLGGNTSGLTPDLLAAYKQIEALMGGNNSANLGIAGEKNGVLTLGNGQTITVTQAEQMINEYTGGGATGATPVFTVTHGYPNANQTSASQTGTYTESTSGTSYLGSVPGTASPAPSTGAGTAGNGSGVTVNVNVAGSLVGSLPGDVVKQIVQAFGDVNNGMIGKIGSSPYMRPAH